MTGSVVVSNKITVMRCGDTKFYHSTLNTLLELPNRVPTFTLNRRLLNTKQIISLTFTIKCLARDRRPDTVPWAGGVAASRMTEQRVVASLLSVPAAGSK